MLLYLYKMSMYKVPKEKYRMCKRIGKMYCPITDRCRDSNSYRKKCLDQMHADFYLDKRNRITPYLSDRGDYYMYLDDEISELPFKDVNEIPLEREEIINKVEIQPHIEKISNALDIDHKTLYENLENLIEVLKQGNINTVSQLKELNNTMRENGIELRNLISNRSISAQPTVQRGVQQQTQPVDDYVSPVWEGRKPIPPPPILTPEQMQLNAAKSNLGNLIDELRKNPPKLRKIEGSGMYGGYYPGYYYDPYYSHFINGRYVG